MRSSRLRKLLVLCVVLIGLPWDIMVANPVSAGFLMKQAESTESSIVENGGFENGLDGWNVVNHFLTSSGLGYPSISEALAHSGKAAVVLNFLSSNYGGGIAQSMELTGIYQTVRVRGLTDLHARAWFSMRIGVSAVAARMRIRVGGFEAKYYVAYDLEQRIRFMDNATSKSILVYQIGPGKFDWWELDRGVLQDFQSLFGSEGQTAFREEQTEVTVALELIGFGPIAGFQLMLWDDVQAMATISPASSVTTTNETTSVLSAISTSSSGLSATSASVSSSSPSVSSTHEEHPLLVAAPVFPVVQISVILVVVSTLVAGFLLAWRGMRRREAVGFRCGRCGARDARADSIYCSQCGNKLNWPAKGQSAPKSTD